MVNPFKKYNFFSAMTFTFNANFFSSELLLHFYILKINRKGLNLEKTDCSAIQQFGYGNIGLMHCRDEKK